MGVGRHRLREEKDKKGGTLSLRSQDLGWQLLPVTLCDLEGDHSSCASEAYLTEGYTHMKKEHGLFVPSTQRTRV